MSNYRALDFRLEYPDPTPVEVPVAFVAPPSIQEMIATYVRSEMLLAGQVDHESWDEANDFDVDEDPEMRSSYEMHEMQEERFLRDRFEADKAARKAARDARRGPAPPPF